jgi:hypothetical protein
MLLEVARYEQYQSAAGSLLTDIATVA